MNKETKTLFSLILFAWVLVSANQVVAAPITGLYYTSSPTSWVGHGETVVIDPSDGFDFFVSRNFDQGVSFAINDFASNPDFWSTRWWYLDFTAPFNQLLQPGHYANATRFPFQDVDDPGLDFSGNGRGNNRLSGFFDVLEVSYGAKSEVLAFAANFTQFDENRSDWWNRGSIRFNSSISLLSVPEPHSLALFTIGAIILFGTLTLRAMGRARERRTP